MLLTLTLASSAFAGEIFIPATFRGPGANGTVWRTDITVTNISTATPLPVQTTITFHKNDSNQTVTIPMTLSKHEVLSVPDALVEWFNVNEGAGIVRIKWDDPNARIAANARVYNVGGVSGEYGQGIPAVRVDRLVTDLYLPGITGLHGNRTNIGISNPHPHANIVWIELIDTSGTSRGAFATGVAPYSYRQFNDIFSAFQAGPLNAAMIRVIGSEGTVYAYASVVRNDSGDATFIAPPE